MDAASQDERLFSALGRIVDSLVTCELPDKAHLQHLFRNLVGCGHYRAGWWVERVLISAEERAQHVVSSGLSTNLHWEHYSRCHENEQQCAMAFPRALVEETKPIMLTITNDGKVSQKLDAVTSFETFAGRSILSVMAADNSVVRVVEPKRPLIDVQAVLAQVRESCAMAAK